MLTVVVKEPGQDPEVREVEPGLAPLKALIRFGTYDMIELVGDGPPGLDLIANEEGKYASELATFEDEDGPMTVQRYAEPNLVLWGGHDFVMGPCFVTAHDNEGEGRTLDEQEVAMAVEWLTQHAVGAPGTASHARAVSLADRFR